MVMNNCVNLKKGLCISGSFMKMIAIICMFACTYSCSDSGDYEIFAGIFGKVTDYETGMTLENAVVTLIPSGLSVQTDAEGNYRFEDLESQQYVVTAQKSGYQPNRKNVTAVSGETVRVDIQLSIIPQ